MRSASGDSRLLPTAKRPLNRLRIRTPGLFRVATRLFNHLFLDETAQDQPLGKTLIDINSLQRWHAACAHLPNCASPSDIKIGKKHEGRRPARVRREFEREGIRHIRRRGRSED